MVNTENAFLARLSNIPLPSECILCLASTPQCICHDCSQALPILGTHCPVCAEPNVHGHICGECLKSKPAFDRVIVPFVFKGPVASILKRLKHSPKVLGLNDLITPLISLLEPIEFDIIIPLPYHWRRLLIRGHSPSNVLAARLARAVNVPIFKKFKRRKHTSSQQSLDKSQRRANMRHAFTLDNRQAQAAIKGKRVLLVDDVLTTGATANEAAKVLKRHGAKSVIVACIARTPNHDLT